MKSILVIALIAGLTQNALGPDSLHAEARELFFRAGQIDPCISEELKELTQGKESPTLQAYYGASLTMMADCLKGPVKKMKSFNEGKEILDQAIQQDPDAAEIRFLRFMVQDGAPAFLNYDNRKEDLAFLMEYFRTSSGSPGQDGFDARMASALLETEFPGEEERKIFMKIK
jgi:hypothetical protein